MEHKFKFKLEGTWRIPTSAKAILYILNSIDSSMDADVPGKRALQLNSEHFVRSQARQQLEATMGLAL